MSKHLAISPAEGADRPAIRELVEAHGKRHVDWIEERALS